MTAFIKYCGGCNESYSRSAAAKLIQSVFSDSCDFISHDASIPCDIGIIISGCSTECIKETELAPAQLYIRVDSMDSAEAAIKQIKSFISKKRN